MPLSVSETSLVTNAYPIQLENSQILFQDELGNSDLLDVEEYSCTNRELVNLENAAVNIDNSNDVIIGPVTQFNVSGNVTIYHNGQNEAINGTTINQEEQDNFKSANSAKLARFEKTESEEQELNKLNKHKKFIKIIVSISFALLVFVGITIVVIHYSNKFEEEAEYIPTEPGDGNNNHLGSHQIFDRTKWNGRPPLNYTNITSPVPLVIIKHTGGGPCFTFLVCAGKLQTIQSQCVSNGAPDIYYNFLIGGDGNIYVGRGWDVQPQQRHDIIDIVFMGSFAFDELTPIMIEAAQLLITDGAKKNKLTKDYKVVSHNQTTATESPGTNVFKEVKTWPHYDSGLYFTDKVLAKDERSLN